MRFLRTIRTALHALRRNVLRAILTTLGIIIGIAAVIAMMEIGHGVSSDIQKTIKGMGTNILLVIPGTVASGGVSFGAGTTVTLSPTDADAIMQAIPNVVVAAPVIHARTQVVYGHRNWVPMNIFGTTPGYLQIRDWTSLAAGDCFTDQDVRNAGKVCVIGQTLVRELFGEQSPVGREIRVQNVTFRVVGVLAAKGGNSMGMDQDDILLAPWTTIKYRVVGSSAQMANQSAAAAAADSLNQVNTLNQPYPNTALSLYPAPSAIQAADTPQPVRFPNVDDIMVQINTAANIPGAITQMNDLLRQRHRIRSGAPDDFSVRDMTDMIKTFTSVAGRMALLLLAVAGISLVVGGVGIMNIMLVSVTERTREIGLRMAVGASPWDILRQFLVEAVVLCLLGGITGILLGRGTSLLVRKLAHCPTEMSMPAIIAAVAVSISVGLVFGFYPAWKAARLDPIEALRYE